MQQSGELRASPGAVRVGEEGWVGGGSGPCTGDHTSSVGSRHVVQPNTSGGIYAVLGAAPKFVAPQGLRR